MKTVHTANDPSMEGQYHQASISSTPDSFTNAQRPPASVDSTLPSASTKFFEANDPTARDRPLANTNVFRFNPKTSTTQVKMRTI